MTSGGSRRHLVALGDLDEAAAFVAALSRFLSSPHGVTCLAQPDAAEVWARVLPDGSTVQVYLNDRGLEAATAAFAPVAVAATIATDDLLPDLRLLFSGQRAPAWGLAEARHRLSRLAGGG